MIAIFSSSRKAFQ